MAADTLLNRTRLPRPDVSDQDAADVLREYFGLAGEIEELGSQQDRNFRITTETGRFVLKICQPEYGLAELEAQNAAMQHLSNRVADIRVPQPVPALSGQEIITVEINGQSYRARVLSYLDGEPLTQHKYLAPEVIAAFGELAAKTAKGLSDFRHPGLVREIQWDLRRAGPVALHLLKSISDQERRDTIAKAMIVTVKRLQPLTSQLRVQAVHHDITDDNIVSHHSEHGRLIPDSVIDFGDVMEGWLVAELAVTCAALLHHADGDPFVILPAVKAFHQHYPLTEPELKALWPLIVARAGILVASSEQQLSIDPDNDYVLGNAAHEREIFAVVTSVPFSLMETAILDAAGFELGPIETVISGPLLPSLAPSDIRLTDLSSTSAEFVEDNWADREIDWKALARAASDTGTASTRYGEYRLSYTRLRAPQPPATFALHVDICLIGGTEAIAPFDATVLRDGHHVILVGKDLSIHVDGIDCEIEEGGTVAAGDRLGQIAGPVGGIGGLRLQLCRDIDLVPPLFAKPQHAHVWQMLCPSPAVVLGFPVEAPAPETAALLAKRQQNFAASQKHYYGHPPQFERGWKEHMFSVEGRAYLDMVNNVTILGHGHPRLSAAIGRQWSMLNTNSRFHYAAVAEFSERLASLAPDGLDTVFLVNSGSEAVDLALRLAWAHTGHRNILSLLEAYHGWTVASDAVSTSIADNPNALETRPGWVRPVLSPNTYRGRFRGEDTTADYVAAVAQKLAEIEAVGEGLAGFIAESVYGNAGGIVLPKGYLSEVYARVRDRGGLCIADEVQIGYGRLGHHFWGFEHQGVIPDIITVAKGMGNGHPLGAVITRRDIADSLEREGYFFSSSGGSPVSSAVGMTVLDVMADEQLQENARTVGDHLKYRLEGLIDQFPIVGAVHGMGLYLGLEFVRNRQTLEPATQETTAICNRLLDLGVIMQPTGDHLNVLKIKPPLCLSIESADFFVDMLEKVLLEGW
ncbi:aminotransferase [Peteryoungia desertarenae]|uniref:Aminotransferase n=1 Tax=Peteryoungia desertarenae TaxID=1813451 RepID=A0ABX6QI30_9HYPH|nr:aminotransferase [Peteryoungia desertarenae]QLF68219.1 aminotransferase [Peteryoungia desertarenae]